MFLTDLFVNENGPRLSSGMYLLTPYQLRWVTKQRLARLCSSLASYFYLLYLYPRCVVKCECQSVNSLSLIGSRAHTNARQARRWVYDGAQNAFLLFETFWCDYLVMPLFTPVVHEFLSRLGVYPHAV